jgi:hypothetical protein
LHTATRIIWTTFAVLVSITVHILPLCTSSMLLRDITIQAIVAKDGWAPGVLTEMEIPIIWASPAPGSRRQKVGE